MPFGPLTASILAIAVRLAVTNHKVTKHPCNSVPHWVPSLPIGKDNIAQKETLGQPWHPHVCIENHSSGENHLARR